MIFLMSFLCACIAFWGFLRRDNFILNPITVMFSIWAIILPLSALGAYDVPPISDKAMLIISVGLIGFLIGNYNGITIEMKVGSTKITNSSENYTLNYPFLYVLYIVSTVYLVSVALVSLRFMMQGYNLDYIRQLSTSEGVNELRSSMFSILMKNFVATPTVYLALAILPIEYILGKKKKSIIILTLIMGFCWVLSTAGRSIILWEILYFFAAIMFAKRSGIEIETSKRFKRIAIIASIILVIFLFWSTVSRKGQDFDVVRQVFLYYIAPLKHFDSYVNLIDSSYHDLYGFGGASFYGFLYPILFAGRILSGTPRFSDFWVTIRELSFDRLEHTTWLGGDIHMNAFVTMFYQPYIDGRLIGSFIICLFFGVVCSKSFRLAFKEKNLKYILVYFLLLQKIVDSMVRFYFTQTSQAMCMIYALFAVIPMSAIVHKNRKQYNGTRSILVWILNLKERLRLFFIRYTMFIKE